MGRRKRREAIFFALDGIYESVKVDRGRPETKEKELNSQRFEDFAAVKTVGACCIVSKLTRMPNVRATFRMRPKIMRLTSHCRAESRAGTPCNSFGLQRRRANHRALESDASP